MTKVLITGANGYIGKHIVIEALRQELDVICIDFTPYDDNRVKNITLNLLQHANDADLYQKLNSPDHIIHLAWQDGFNHKADSHLDNLPAHYAFVKNMIDSGCPSISVMGSMHEVGYYEGEINENTPCNPLSLYGIAKNALRQAIAVYVNDKNVSFKWLRAFYITGDDTHNKSVFSKILEMAEKKQTSFPFTNGLNKYDFEDIDTLAHQIVCAATQQKVNGIINCCSGKPVSLKDKVEEFIASHDLDIKPEYGAFPSRKYDSPAIWGGVDKIKSILENN